MFKRLKKNPLHPFFLAAYAIFGVFIQNANEIPPIQILRPLFIILFFMGIIFYLINLKVKNIHRAGLLATLFLFLVVFYGHIYFSLMLFPSIQELPGRDYIIFFSWFLIILALASPFIWRKFSSPQMVTSFLNTVSFLVLLAPLISIGFTLQQTALQNRIFLEYQNNSQLFINIENENINKNDLPDIYYIILDAYSREDVLKSEFGFDNSSFIARLEERGFYIAKESQSNYMQTQLSLSSSLSLYFAH